MKYYIQKPYKGYNVGDAVTWSSTVMKTRTLLSSGVIGVKPPKVNKPEPAEPKEKKKETE